MLSLDELKYNDIIKLYIHGLTMSTYDRLTILP